MSSITRNLDILEIIHHLGKTTRMEVFHAFDGTMKWEELKRRISGLTFEKLVSHQVGETPDKPKLISLTKEGVEVVKAFVTFD